MEPGTHSESKPKTVLFLFSVHQTANTTPSYRLGPTAQSVSGEYPHLAFLVGCDKTLSGYNNKRASTKKGVVKIFIVSFAGEERSHCKEWHWRALQSIRTPIERQHANTVTELAM